MSVRLGEHNLKTDPDCHDVDGTVECADPVQDIDIAEAIPHDQFNQPAFANDIALVRLVHDANMVPGLYTTRWPATRF